MNDTITTTRKAHVYHGPGRHGWEDVARPRLQAPGDAIVRVDAVTICGTDLHINKGDVPEVTPGRILGHETEKRYALRPSSAISVTSSR